MTSLKFVDEIPPDPGGGRKAMQEALRQLRQEPGRWAEIARYSKDRRGSAHSRGHQLAQRHADIEHAVRTVGDEVVLYLRAVAR